MMGHMALIQNLAQGQEELRILIIKLHQDEYNCMGWTDKIGDQIINQPPIRQEVGLVESRPFWIATTSQAQQRPRQQQQGSQCKQDTSKRQYTKLNMPMSQAL